MSRKDNVFVVGIRYTDQKDFENKVSALAQEIMEFDFVTDVLEYESEVERKDDN